jgi:D-glycerate 3-kinase
VHPLLRTRGVPGTHDIPLLVRTLDALIVAGSAAIPRFSKATDDRVPAEDWEVVAAPVDVVLLEGWCLGAHSEAEETLVVPVNDLEREEDPDARWRRFINECLRRDYEPLYDRFSLWLMLAAPGFEQVLRWRTEQEAKLRERVDGEGSGLMDEAALRRFVAHFERHTRQCLRQLPGHVDVLFTLDAERRITASRAR